MGAITTQVPQIQWTPAGFVVPTEQAILAAVLMQFSEAFDGNCNLALNTPQGQLATAITAMIGAQNNTFLFYANNVDPAFSSGRMQDGIGRIYFIERNPAQSTVVQCDCVGAVGTIIPTGALAIAQDGNIYNCTNGGTIPITGTISLQFACNVVGPISCPEGTLNAIYRVVPGWDSINNPSDGVIGTNVESRNAFEDRRAASVAKNSIGSLPSVLGAVLSVAGVLDAYVVENDENINQTIGGVVLAPNSIWVSAIGGSSAAVAQAIWSRKSPGCAYNGNTTVLVQDTSPQYIPPFPTYSVSYEIPASLPIIFSIKIINTQQVPANARQLIQAALTSAFAGTDVVGQRIKIGTAVLASRFYPTIAALGAWAAQGLISIYIGSVNNTSWTGTASISGTTLTVASTATGALAIGQTLFDTTGDLTAGTTIVSGSGSSWTVSNSQTVSTESMSSAVANLSEIVTTIAQEATFDINDVELVLV